jgi:hypothetical protein
MTNSEDFRFERTSAHSHTALSEFIIKQTKNRSATPEYLQWWFMNNPVSSSMQHALLNGRIAGFASTNNFKMYYEGEEKTVAMPQKVLTDSQLRGKGLFSKLYFKTEEENIQLNHVDFFLTFTNDASTPIFINKFGYKRGISPDVLLIFPGLNVLLSKHVYSVVELPEKKSEYHFTASTLSNSIIKNAEYFRWRYFSFSNEIIMLTSENGAETQSIFLKRVVKSKIPFYAVLDIVAESEAGVTQMLRYALHYSLRKLSAGLMTLDHPQINSAMKNFLHYKVKNRFHFLVKGKNQEETNTLAATKFNFTFGDLDFI